MNLEAALAPAAARPLLAFLAKTEEPVRVRAARESLQLRVAQMGLAMRSLERYGLAVRRNLPVDSEDGTRNQHPFIEATDLGREHARGILRASAPPPPLG